MLKRKDAPALGTQLGGMARRNEGVGRGEEY
jgi:hypothetical protein